MTLRIAGGLLKGRALSTPPEHITRPTKEKVRLALFNICQWEIEGAVLADLFAGSGAIGLEALSRGAQRAYFLEQNPKALHVLKHNISHCEMQQSATIFRGDVSKGLIRLPLCDIIFCDPPYGTQKDDADFLAAMPITRILKPSGRLFYESRHPTGGAFQNGLELRKNRRFGDTYLNEYVVHARRFCNAPA